MNRFINTIFLFASTTILMATASAEAAQVRPVTFESQGKTLVGNLYLPDDCIEGQELPGVVVTDSWTSVKEQITGLPSILSDNARAFYSEVQGTKSIEWLEGLRMDYYNQPKLIKAAAHLVAEHFEPTLR